MGVGSAGFKFMFVPVCTRWIFSLYSSERCTHYIADFVAWDVCKLSSLLVQDRETADTNPNKLIQA